LGGGGGLIISIFFIPSGKKVYKKEGRIKGFFLSNPDQPQPIHNPDQGII